jgi:hypothetical protein
MYPSAASTNPDSKFYPQAAAVQNQPQQQYYRPEANAYQPQQAIGVSAPIAAPAGLAPDATSPQDNQAPKLFLGIILLVAVVAGIAVAVSSRGGSDEGLGT